MYLLYQRREIVIDARIKSITVVVSVLLRRPFPRRRYPSPPPRRSKALVDSTIESGGKLYDYNYAELCMTIYTGIQLNKILDTESEDKG